VDRGDHGGMEFGGKMGACSKDGVQHEMNERLVILREETTDGWSRVTDEDERVARVGWSVINL